MKHLYLKKEMCVWPLSYIYLIVEYYYSMSHNVHVWWKFDVQEGFIYLFLSIEYFLNINRTWFLAPVIKDKSW